MNLFTTLARVFHCSIVVLSISIAGNAFADTNCTPTSPATWWQAEGNAVDSAGTNNGTLINGVTFDTGQFGDAFQFNGTNTYVQIPSSPELEPAGPFSVEGWLKFDRITSVNGGTVIAKGRDYNGPIDWALTVSGSRQLRPHLNTTTWHYFDCGTVLSTGAWYHVAMVYDGAQLKGYVNGVLDGAQNVTGSPRVSDHPVRLGAYAPVNGGAFSTIAFAGLLDEVSVYGRALTPLEIETLYLSDGGKCLQAPFIVVQPTNQTVLAGGTVSFSVVAMGAAPLSYQWSLNGTNLDGAVQASLTLTNVQLSDAGSYVVQVVNAQGFTNSSAALLTVTDISCVTPPAELVAWWRGEGDASDTLGAHNGISSNNPAFAIGKVGESFLFNGAGAYVEVPSSPTLKVNGPFTVEAWVNFERGSSTIVAKGADVDGPVDWAMTVSGARRLRPHVYVGGWHYFDCSTVLSTGVWHHVAMVYDGIKLQGFVNGVADGSINVSGPVRTSNHPLRLGAYAPLNGGSFSQLFFAGQLDEVSLYNRALSGTEIQGIYNAQQMGKCDIPFAPFIVSQPQSRSELRGANATFTVAAGGTAPLHYQWLHEELAIGGATNALLVVSNVQTADAGSYSVQITNDYGSILSSNAILTVILPPAEVRIVGTNIMGGQAFTVPVLLVANGNENVLDFSLEFDPQKLSFVGAVPGDGADGAALFMNSSQAGNGRLGLAIAYPAEMTFAAGTQEVLQVSFTSSVLLSSTPVQTPISFTDLPVARQLSDDNAQLLPAVYTGGSIEILPSELEADVAPRPTGNRSVGATDWSQIGRFVARLDTPADGPEFQRADSAPRSTLGDGKLKVTDWVQAGRYVVSLDPWAAIGGPDSAVEMDKAASRDPQVSGLDTRTVRLENRDTVKGLPVIIPIILESQSNENALAFSVEFSPATFRFSGVSLGSSAGGAALTANTNQAAAGKVGIVLGLSTGNNFATGAREIARVHLVALSSGTHSVSFGDDPVPRGISDPTANELSADYVANSVVINDWPRLQIAQTSELVTLSWPTWATAFDLQSSASLYGIWTNVVAAEQIIEDKITVTLPASEEMKLFRLHHP